MNQVWWYTPVIPALVRLSRRMVGLRPAWAIQQVSVFKKKKKKRK
jgi:hypothetical protein